MVKYQSKIKNHGTGGNLGWDYYYAMAFGGLYYKDGNGNLVETDSFKALVPDAIKRQEIKNILSNEEQGNTSSKGTKC